MSKQKDVIEKITVNMTKVTQAILDMNELLASAGLSNFEVAIAIHLLCATSGATSPDFVKGLQEVLA